MTDRSWADMTADEKLAWRIDRWRNSPIEFVSPDAEADHEARLSRLITALTLNKPDRVPISLNTGFLPAYSAGMTPYDALNDLSRARKAWIDFNLKFQPDAMCDPVHYTTPAEVLEKLDYRLYRWPGHGIPREAGYQYNEREWMLAEEYDELISDPSGYLLRLYLPRTVGAFSGFAGLSSFMDFIELPFVSGHLGAWGSPEMAAGLERLAGAARAAEGWGRTILPTMDHLAALGFPFYRSTATKAPFDILGDTLRGTKAVILDLFRRPEKVSAACERLVRVAIDWALRRPVPLATPVVYIPLHKGIDRLLSHEEFATFYWPSLRKVILGLIDEGMIPLLFAEGRFASRLEVIMDVPKGRTAWLFAQTDLALAKQTIGKIACIGGNLPVSLLYGGTPEKVAIHTRKMIDAAAEGGGYIMDLEGNADEGKDENLLAMIRTAREYGVY